MNYSYIKNNTACKSRIHIKEGPVHRPLLSSSNCASPGFRKCSQFSATRYNAEVGLDGYIVAHICRSDVTEWTPLRGCSTPVLTTGSTLALLFTLKAVAVIRLGKKLLVRFATN